MKKLSAIIALALCSKLAAQPNCMAYLYEGDTLKYEACQTAEKRAGHYQFSKEYQEALDEALEIDSTFSYAYKVKSTAYLKSGDFITWKALIDKAVEYDPEGELFYRASCRFQFFRDYKGTIDDIELLDSLVDYDIGFGQNGDYHLEIIRGLCYKMLGEPDIAIEIISKKLAEPDYSPSPYDYLHLGVLYLEKNDYPKAIEALEKQEKENDIAENRYYKSLALKEVGEIERYKENLALAEQLYREGSRMFDLYAQHLDKVYLRMIHDEIELSRYDSD
jgi:tetratricopeptide (TPR) repeat protein